MTYFIEYLGNLTIIEVYDFYDRPIMFSCRNKTGQYFVVMWIDEDDDGNETWLYAPISYGRLQQLHLGQLSTRSAFVDAEDAYVFRVEIVDKQIADVASIPTSDLTDEMLPEEGIYIQAGRVALEAASSNTAVEYAMSTNRDSLFVKLQFPNIISLESPADKLGAILQSLQKTFDAFSNRDPEGAYPELRFVGHALGSYEIRLASSTNDMFENESLFVTAARRLEQVLEVAANRDETKIFLLESGGRRSAKCYLDFLNAVKRSNTQSITLNWASYNATQSGTVTVASPVVDALIEQLRDWKEVEEARQRFTGILRGYLPRSGRFEIEITEEGDSRSLEGRLDSGASSETISIISRATLGSYYKFIVIERTTTDIATDMVKTDLFLLSIEPE